MNKIFNESCILTLAKLDDDSVDLIFADPPFNLSKNYNNGLDDQMTEEEYLKFTSKWLKECQRVLKPGGSLFYYNIPKWAIHVNQMLPDLEFRNWITVMMKNGMPIRGRLYPAHYALLYYTKGKPKTFTPDRLLLEKCRHCDGDIKDYGGHRKKLNPSGISLSDIWVDISPVRHSKYKNRDANELPLKLLDRIISMASKEGDIVYDPFMGTGTTAVVAKLLKRQYLGSEIGDIEVIEKRLNNLEEDHLLLKKIHSLKNRLE